jgi:hypothetical protein
MSPCLSKTTPAPSLSVVCEGWLKKPLLLPCWTEVVVMSTTPGLSFL